MNGWMDGIFSCLLIAISNWYKIHTSNVPFSDELTGTGNQTTYIKKNLTVASCHYPLRHQKLVQR